MIGYLDLPSGLSGDMFLGCLVDAGWPVDELTETVRRLRLPEGQWAIRAEPVMRGPLRATLLTVVTNQGDHHRHLDDIRRLIGSAGLAPAVQERAIAVFTRLAEAEARVHGMSVQDVHFHEVGALDAIIDIVGVAAGLEALGLQRIFAGAVPLGPGWVTTAHGTLPLPAPATLELLAAAGAPTRPAPGPGELVTPTGAALLATFATFSQPEMCLRRIALGAGRREFAWPNIARLWVGEPVGEGALVQIETNIDDMNPELYGVVSEKLFASGARDVWITPIQMKKNRPGVLLQVLAPQAREEEIAHLLLRETTTLGLRVYPVRRHEARRELRTVETRYGTVHVKLKWLEDTVMGAIPEYEDCRQLATLHDAPLRLVYDAALVAAHQAFLQAGPQVDGDP